MGNGQSQLSKNNSYPVQDLPQYNLLHYGGKVLVDKVKKLVFKMIEIPSEEQEDFLKMVNKRIKLDHPNFAKVIDFFQVKASKKQLCGSTIKKYTLVYGLFAYSLTNEIQNCCKLKKPIPEPEICRIFQEVVQCLAYLNSQQTLHGDIKVGSIFMDKDKNVKLVDSFFLKQGKTSYEIILEDPKSLSILTPQQLDLLRTKLFDSLESIQQKQMFMVGLCMIEATTIQEALHCYNLEELKMRDEFFIFMMEHIQTCGYSRELSNCIMNCVHKDNQMRPSYSKFLQIIREIRSRPISD